MSTKKIHLYHLTFSIRSQIIIGEDISHRGPPPAFTFISYKRTEP